MAQPKEKTARKLVRGSRKDDQLLYATDIDPGLEQWRKLAAEWVGLQREDKSHAMDVMKIFLLDYIHDQGLEADPPRFLSAGYKAPCLYETCLSHYARKDKITYTSNRVSSFISYVLTNYFSVEDDDGNAVISPGFRNPVPPLPAAVNGHRRQLQESNKNVLPFHFVKQLREMLCPKQAQHFRDWAWAQGAEDSNKGGGWFVVPLEAIDPDDPDCVWRQRETSKYERETLGLADDVHELWSPARAVAIWLKLQLPLRTYQVRMLDSGEADTQRYIQGKWVKNTGPLAKGSEKNPWRRGVFRQMVDDIHHRPMTGLYINTNKTADQLKETWSKGYSIPWEHPEVLYWLDKLRSWQEKYNPITAPTAWTDLELKHLGHPKSDSQLKEMGSTCFLFRDAAATGSDRNKPLADKSVLEQLWYKLLHQLEEQCAVKKIFDLAGKPLKFIPNLLSGKVTTSYPLHALRVSLITAFVLEGGVPMAILSKCIAGHSRLLMTLYYTKAGIQYCSEVMDEASKRLMATEQENYVRWLKDKSYQQLESHGAYGDPAAIQAMMQSMQQGASLTKDDKGFCPKGGWACDSGGVYVNDDTGKVSYGEVPGYPQKNCPRCRWFFTGPAFVDGLNNHWNNIQLQMGDVGERIVRLEGQIAALEDEQFECQERDLPFLEIDQLNTRRKVHQQEYEKNNKLAEDLNATFRLIAKCVALAKQGKQDEKGVQLVAVGGLQDVQVAIAECDKLHQVLTAVAGSAVYPEHDVSKAVLQAGKAFDMMLERNGKNPVLFRLTEEELPYVVQHVTRLLIAEAGSIKEAVPFIDGAHQLSELGLDMELLAQEMASGPALALDSLQRLKKPLRGRPDSTPFLLDCSAETI